MIRRETPNRITKPSVKTFKILVIIFTRKRKEKNMVGKLHDIGVKLDRTPGNISGADPPVSSKIVKVRDPGWESGRFWLDVFVRLVDHE
jgi:hypothetical protein